MRDSAPRIDDVGVDVDDAFGVPEPVVADVPVPADDLAAGNQRVAWTPVCAGRAARTVAALIAGAIRLRGGHAETAHAHAAGHHHRSGQPGESVHGRFLSLLPSTAR